MFICCTAIVFLALQGNKKAPYPMHMATWSGWPGFFSELGPAVQAFMIGNLCYAIQHFGVGEDHEVLMCERCSLQPHGV